MTTVDEYITLHSSVEPVVLQELVRQTHLRVPQPRMLSGAVQGRLLSMFVSMLAPCRVLEIGTFTGYSTISMAESLPSGGVIDTIEIDDELESIASEFFVRSGFASRIRTHFGPALQVIDTLSIPENEHYGLVFMDADKREYSAYYDKLFDRGLVASGSVILADNTLWSGKVLVDQVDRKDAQTIELKRFNVMVASDQRVEKVMLPLRDGLTVIRVK